jgi:proline iminopeptidase
MDHRGFALNPNRPLTQDEYELDVIIEDIERVRQHLGLDQIIILGHSGHGYMALEYAKKYPEHVSHIVMLGIIPNLSPESNVLIEQFWQDSVSPDRKTALKMSEQKFSDEKLLTLSPSQRFIKQYIRSGARIWYDFNFDASPLWEGVEINMEIFTYIWGTVFRDIDITQGLDKFDKPVFLGLGRYDFLAPYCLWNPIRSKFKNLTVRVFEKSGHTPQYEEAKLFDEELIKWLYEQK